MNFSLKCYILCKQAGGDELVTISRVTIKALLLAAAAFYTPISSFWERPYSREGVNVL